MTQILQIIVSLFAVTSMLAVGLAHTFQEILDPLRNPRRIIGAIISNFVFVPILTLLIFQLLPLSQPLKIGLFLLATASGAPFLIKLTVLARADLATSTALLIMLLLVTILYMPLVVPLALPETNVKPGVIAFSLISTMLLPLVVGLIIRQWRANWSNSIFPWVRLLSSASMVVMIVLILLVHYQAILGILGSGAILAGLLFTLGAYTSGYLSGGKQGRVVHGLAASQRNIAAATVVASQDFDHPHVLVMVTVTSLVALFVLLPISWVIGRQRREVNDA